MAMIVPVSNVPETSNEDAWRRPVAERLRIIASQIEAGNVSSVIVLSHCGGHWIQDIRYADQYEAVGAMEQTKLQLLLGRI